MNLQDGLLNPRKPMLIRDQFLLKFAFLWIRDDEQTMKIMNEQIEILKLNWNGADKTVSDGASGIYVRLLLNSAKTQNKMYLEWLAMPVLEIENNLKGAFLKKSLVFYNYFSCVGESWEFTGNYPR